MSPITRILVLLLAMGGGMLYKRTAELWGPVAAPDLPLDQWWGEGEAPADWEAYVQNTSEVIGNRLSYPDTSVDHVRDLLNETLRLTDPLEGAAFEYGFNTKYLREVVDYWLNDYMPRWRAREVFLWQFNHFTTEIQGLRMHFLHLMVYDEHKVGRQHYPVLLLHGWPSSIREYYTLIHKLHQTKLDKNNKYIFDVIVPSLPGFGWSQGPSKPGMGPAQMAVVLRQMMLRLGYTKFFIHGGDWGSVVGSHIATLFPENVIGYHSTMCLTLTPKSIVKGLVANMMPSLFAPHGYKDFFFPYSAKWQYLISESGYLHEQATKPDTLGAVLTDNPVGLAAYILEKFSVFTDPENRHLEDGGFKQNRFKMDALLDNVMIYHFTNSITTSARIYAEGFSRAQFALKMDRVPTRVPTGCARFKHEILHTLDFQLKDKYPNLIHSTYYREGGHFAAFEMPSLLYHDFIEFVKKVERLNGKK